MRNKRILARIKKLLMHFQKRLGSKIQHKLFQVVPGRFHSISYQLIGDKTERILPIFKDLDVALLKAGLKMNFKAYVSLIIVTTILVSLTTIFFIPCLLAVAFGVPFFSAVLFGFGGGLFATAFSVIGFYAYPVYRADAIKRKLEDELSFTAGYMAILASAGVSPEKILYSVANLPAPLTASEEAKNVVRDVNLFGLDIISALQKASKRTPSKMFREMLEGFMSTIHSGGDLAAYLREKSRQYMKLKRMSLRKFSDTLSISSEFYVALLVTGPLLLVIMLTVMAMLGGGTLGMPSADLLLNLLIYLGIPLGSITFLIVLDAISPSW